MEKLYHEYHQADAQHKAEMTGKAVSAHVVSIYSKGVSRVLKIDSVEQLRKDIESDPVIIRHRGLAGGYVWEIFSASAGCCAHSESRRSSNRRYNK